MIGGAEEQDEEEEVLIEQEEEGEMVTEKKGVAGDERNIAVLLFLYVLQVDIRQSQVSDVFLTNSCCRASLLAWLLPSRLYSLTKMSVS